MPRATTSSGAQIHYQVHGDSGPWVVLLMGLGAPSSLWLDLPERLAGTHRVLTVDSLGTGRSDRVRRPLSMTAMASHVVSAMDAAGCDRAYVVGLSMGGMIAQHVALGHPSRVAGLVLMATTPGIVHGGLPTLRALRSLVRTALRPHRTVARELVGDLILHPEERHRAHEIIRMVGPAFRDAPTSGETFLWQLAACALHSTGGDLGAIAVPTIVITGDHDIVMGSRASRVLASRIPHAVLEIVPRCGHGINFTHPEVLERALSRLEARSARV